ncbi:hypothetical protein [Cytobacillus firmus]|uniref:hypothetical protein n=1 Tax=Cytobacillus firmus TaxID=1399 RepID=UPI0018CF3ACC|nr:hypothetical protein [Cytobacillus firmus]
MDIVNMTLKKLKQGVGDHFHTEAILHSEQGFHYTHPQFQSKVKKLGLRQSMSRKGNCWEHQWKVSLGTFNDLAEYKSLNNLGVVKKEVDRVIEEFNQHVINGA